MLGSSEVGDELRQMAERCKNEAQVELGLWAEIEADDGPINAGYYG